MANCNCNDFPISCAPHAPGGDCCHPHGCPPHPCPPPPFKGGTSMYIGARYVPIFADPVEWDDEREYEPLTIVTHNGDCYTSKCYVPKGAQLPPYPEGQTKYWVKTSDYNGQFADLKKTVLDLSRLVEQFQKDNKDFTDLIHDWNEKVIQWEKDMAAWGERLDTVESNVADLTASLNAEIARAKAAEQANAAAIAQETTDRKQAISELDAAYKAADAAEAWARAEADTALSNRITANTTDIDAIKAEQVIQNTNISANAKNISDNAAEIAKHAARLTDLESNASDWDDAFPDTTIAQEVQKEENTRANAVTELKAKDTQLAADIEEVRDLANHKVDQTAFQAADALNVKYTTATKTALDIPTSVAVTAEPITRNWLNTNYALTSYENNKNVYAKTTLAALALKTEVDTAQAAADKANTNIGDWGSAFPDRTITNVTQAANNFAWRAHQNIGEWETDHPGQTISQCATSLENELAATDAKADANAANIGDWNTEHPGKTISQAVSDNTAAVAAEQSAREAADTALGKRIDAIEGGARHYPTLALLLKKENPLFVPVAGIATCTYDTMTKKTTISYKNVEGRYFLPPNVTCDESQAVLTGILTAYGGAYYLPASGNPQDDENTVVTKVITSDTTPTDFDISGDSTKILRVRFDSDIVSNTFDSNYERFVVSNFSVAIEP